MSLIPEIPDQMPTMGNGFTRALGRGILRMVGWKITGEIPKEPKLIVAVAPHTSNWDFVMAAGTLLALGLKVSAMMKKEAFFWPFKGLFMSLGFMPIDRSDPRGLVTQMKDKFSAQEQVWLGITPEGTRSKVPRWKTGFLRIAEETGVPIVLVGIHAGTREIVFDKIVTPTGDHEGQAEEVRLYINEKFQGINTAKQ